MTKRVVRLPLIGLSVLGMVTLAAWAGDGHEERVTLDQVPDAVRTTILNEAAGAKITEIEREIKGDRIFYEAEFMLDGSEIEIRIAPDGKLLGREVENEADDDDELTIDQVPEPAQGALRMLAGDAAIANAEREREGGVLMYEAAWVANGTMHEAKVMADGSLVETEQRVSPDEVPDAVRAAIMNHFPADAKLSIERKMVVVYEVEARIDGREQELMVFPTGLVHESHDEDDEGDGHHDHDDDDDHDHHDDED